MAEGHGSRHNWVMHWVMVGDLAMPKCIGGHPALDFCNTWAGWDEPPNPRREWLRSYDHLAVWAWHAGLIEEGDAARLRRSGARSPDAAAAQLRTARRLRTLLHSAVVDPADGRALGGVTGFVRRAGEHVRIRPGTPPRWEIPPATGLELPIHAVVWAAGDLLTSDSIATVKACPGDDCGWLFLDPRGRRRWCSMSSCGNRAKVRAHAQRQRRA
jgi:predicted RNA-binding Zn ribbon-like protein